MITKNESTGYLIDSVYTKLKSIIGVTFTNTNLASLPITYVQGFPRDYEALVNVLPVVFIEPASRLAPEAFEQGGDRKYTVVIQVHIIAGGYVNDSHNELMKQNIMDKILFGFDTKVYDLINPYTGAVEGRYNTIAREVTRYVPNTADAFEQHHGQVTITSWMLINNL